MISPLKVKEAAKKRENENIKFRTFLKCNADEHELDKQFLALHNELFAEYDCNQCRNCCREYSIELEENDITLISAFLRLDSEEFISKHLAKSENEYKIKAPCCFLDKSNNCMIEECRPKTCKEFPHTNKPERLWSLLGVLSFAEVCPVVFEILERLKRIYRFKTR